MIKLTEISNSIGLLDVVGLSLRKYKKQLEFLLIHSATALTHLGRISGKEHEILTMISNDNYYLDDLLEECSSYLPQINIRKIYNISWSITKIELHECSRYECLTQLCFETLSIHPKLNKIRKSNIELEYIRHGCQLMYDSGQIDNELISQRCNQLTQMSMISIESDAHSRIRDNCIDLVIISATIDKLVINQRNDMFFSDDGAQLVYSLLKHFVGKEFSNTSAINGKIWFLNGFSNIMKYSSSCGQLRFNYELRILDKTLTRQEDGQGNHVEIDPLHVASMVQCVNRNDLLIQSNLFDVDSGTAGSEGEKEDEEQGNDRTILIFLKMYYKKT